MEYKRTRIEIVRLEDEICNGGGDQQNTELLQELKTLINKASEPDDIQNVIVSHLKALTKKIEDSHCYGFDDVLEEYLKENSL